MADKPKPCPWCGWSGNKIDISPGDTYRWMLPFCPECGATPGETRVRERMPNGAPLSESEANCTAALEMWNKRASPWRTIATAPKDGTHILCRVPDSDTCYVIAWADFRKGIRAEYGSAYVGWHLAWDGTFFHPYEAPTHWQPLPEPPKD